MKTAKRIHRQWRHWPYVIFVLLLLLTSLAKTVQAANMAGLVGQWYTEVREDKNKVIDGRAYAVRRELLINRTDGTKTNIERYYSGNRLVYESVSTFRWGVTGNVYWSMCQTIVTNGKASSCSYRSEYDIIAATPGEFRYKSRNTGVTYVSYRKPDAFRLP
jgi:hypothetical protein